MAERETRWTSNLQAAYPLITETALSPDGAWVVYAVREPLMTESESRYLVHLYVVSADGGEPIQLTCGRHSNSRPRWSPDGQYLAFLSDRGDAGKTNVYAMRIAGGEPWALTAYTETSVLDVKWSPSGQHLAFLMAEPPSAARVAARKAKDDVMLWDQDFDFVQLFTVPFAVAPRVLPKVSQRTKGRLHIVKHAWMPDGKAIALVARPRPTEDSWTETRLYLVPLDLVDQAEPQDTDALIELGLLAAWAPDPVPSPDGQWIACVTGDRPVRWAFASRVVLYRADGSGPRPLASTPDGQCWLLGWSTDGSRVYVGQVAGVDTHIWALPASGGGGTPVVATPTAKGAMHTPGNDKVAFVEETFTDPNRVCIWSAGATEPRSVVVPLLPEGWPTGGLPAVEVLRWQATDGLEVEGIVIYPLGYEPGSACPLVVEVHGGPAGVFQRRFLGSPDSHCDVLAFAERGYAVLRVNPRGSSGYGRTFRFSNYGDWGGGDYGDIVAGVDTLIARDIADPDRMVIMGWSYGGYMTSWAITQTRRFRASCIRAGVTNLVSFTGTADVPGFLPDYFGAEFWVEPELYLQRSALFNVQGVTTPALIQHGAVDARVPLSQSLEFYNALKRQGVPVEMIVYPRQAHDMSEPRMAIDVRRRPVAWFAKWVEAE